MREKVRYGRRAFYIILVVGENKAGIGWLVDWKRLGYTLARSITCFDLQEKVFQLHAVLQNLETVFAGKVLSGCLYFDTVYSMLRSSAVGKSDI